MKRLNVVGKLVCVCFIGGAWSMYYRDDSDLCTPANLERMQRSAEFEKRTQSSGPRILKREAGKKLAKGLIERTNGLNRAAKDFRIGQIYDAVHEKVLDARSLFNDKEIQQAKLCVPQPFSDAVVTLDDTLKTRLTSTSVNLAISLSYLFFSINFNGDYFQKETASLKKAGALIDYKMTSRSEFVQIPYLVANSRNLTEHPLFKNPRATHIIAGITYGGNVVLNLNSEVSESYADKEKKSGTLGEVASLLGKVLSALASENYGPKDEAKVDYYGNLGITQEPRSVAEVIKILGSVGELTGKNGENTVPVKLWLYPLSNILASAKKKYADIPAPVVDNMKVLQEKKYMLLARVNDLKAKAKIAQYPFVKKQVMAFEVKLKELLDKVTGELAELMLEARSNPEGKSAINEVIREFNKSPFSIDKLDRYVQTRQTEIDFMDSFASSIQDTEKLKKNQRDTYIRLSTKKAKVYLLLEITFPEPNHYFDTLTSFVEESESEATAMEERVPWFENEALIVAGMQTVSQFRAYEDQNRDVEKFSFYQDVRIAPGTASVAVKMGKPGSKFHDFAPITTIDAMTVTITGKDTAYVKWEPYHHKIANVTKYVLFVKERIRKKQQNEYLGYANTKQNNATVDGLELGREYYFDLRVYTDYGQSSHGKQIYYRHVYPLPQHDEN